jgi:hypothetical protein
MTYTFMVLLLCFQVQNYTITRARDPGLHCSITILAAFSICSNLLHHILPLTTWLSHHVLEPPLVTRSISNKKGDVMSFVECFACCSILSEKAKPTNILLSQKGMVDFFQLIFTVQCHLPSTYWHPLTWDLHTLYI